NRAVRDALAAPLTVVFAGFSCWLAAAEIEPVWATVAIFAVMIAGLLRAMSIAMRYRRTIAGWPGMPRHLLWWMLGIYTGWSTIAIWVNLTTAFVGSGAPSTGPVGIVGQMAVLAGATATAVTILRWANGLLPYTLAALWALLGAVFGAIGAQQTLLAGAAAAGAAIVIAAGVPAWRHRGRIADWASGRITAGE
ncbi:hypothetical protein ABZW02_34470, partial [Streptomyces sp. NPDC005180]